MPEAYRTTWTVCIRTVSATTIQAEAKSLLNCLGLTVNCNYYLKGDTTLAGLYSLATMIQTANKNLPSLAIVRDSRQTRHSGKRKKT